MDLFAKDVKDVFFNFDKADIRPDQTPVATEDATFLKQHPAIKVLVECTATIAARRNNNIALGQSRAQTLKEQLLRNGVSADCIKTISYGKEKPFCTADDECWQENRRAHLVPQQ